MEYSPVRRVVTGHDADGRAIIQEDGPVSRVQRVGGEIGPIFHEVWNTTQTLPPSMQHRVSLMKVASRWHRQKVVRASGSSTFRQKATASAR